MQHYRYTQEEIEELCRIPPWTDSSLDQQTQRIHDQVPLTRRCIVDQCLFWCDVAQRFKRHMHGRRRVPDSTDPDKPLDFREGTFIVGVIGCGAVGSKFVKELLKRDMVKPNQIKISSRTPSRAKQRCGLEVVQNNTEVASHCTILFLFVLPFHFRNFSREIRDAIQGNRPLVVSSLAGFTPLYLQRALNTPFLITTGIDMSTIQAASEHFGEEFPLEQFATGDELVHFQECFMGVFDVGSQNPPESGEDETKPKEHVSGTPSTDHLEPMEVNPFQMKLSDPKLKRKVHEAAFAAENMSNCGIEFLNVIMNALKDWVALDPNHAKIQAKPETYNKLWTRSFIPLSSVTRVESIQTNGSVEQQMPVRFMLKRAYIRSLVGAQLGETSMTENKTPAQLLS